jgi:hypothetical protein
MGIASAQIPAGSDIWAFFSGAGLLGNGGLTVGVR